MIVKDHVLTIQKAGEVSHQIYTLLCKEIQEFNVDDDPAEKIYLTVHIIGDFIARLTKSLEGFGKVYGIPNLNCDSIMDFFNMTIKDYNKIYKEVNDEK